MDHFTLRPPLHPVLNIPFCSSISLMDSRDPPHTKLTSPLNYRVKLNWPFPEAGGGPRLPGVSRSCCLTLSSPSPAGRGDGCGPGPPTAGSEPSLKQKLDLNVRLKSLFSSESNSRNSRSWSLILSVSQSPFSISSIMSLKPRKNNLSQRLDFFAVFLNRILDWHLTNAWLHYSLPGFCLISLD